MPKPTLALKATVARRPSAEPVPPDMVERLEQLRHHQSAENARQTVVEAATGTPEEPSGKDRKQSPHAVQAAFLSGNLGKPVTVTTLNNIRLTGKLRQFDPFTLLLEGPDGIHSLIFKHAITTVTPTSEAPGKQRQPTRTDEAQP